MKRPRYTDLHRYPHGWTASNETDVKATIERAREKQKAEAERERMNIEERLRKTIQLRKSK